MKALFLAAMLIPSILLGPSWAADSESKQGSVEEPRASAIFAGGCFWCMEHPFDELDGVLSTTSGYAGGHVPSPTYHQVSAGGTGHAEVVRVIYDPSKIGYGKLLEVFWHNVDPLDAGGQFCDRGDQYRSAIFYANEEQRQLAEQSKQALVASGRFDKPIVTTIVPATDFYPAEDYHQNYYMENPLRYHFYRRACGRDNRLEELWGVDQEKSAG